VKVLLHSIPIHGKFHSSSFHGVIYGTTGGASPNKHGFSPCRELPPSPPYFAHLLPVITPYLNAKNTIKNRIIFAGLSGSQEELTLSKFLAGLSLEKYEEKLREYGVEVVFLC
jgi:hypothetical protein